MMSTEIVYLSHANTVELVLVADGSVPSLSAVTRMTLTLGSTLIDSAVAAGVFDWSQTLTAAEVARIPGSGAQVGDSKLIISLGAQAVTPDDYDTAYLILYSPAWLTGLVWGSFRAAVLADIEAT